MRITYITVVLFLLYSISCFANEQTRADTKLIYCPTQIHCTKNGCDLSTEAAKYFTLPLNATKCVDFNKFKYALSSFHTSTTAGSCWYEGAHVGTCDGIMLTIKPEANLEAYYKPGVSEWSFSEQGSKCTSATSSVCPLQERLGFVIYNMNVTNGIFVSSNAIKITNLIPPNKYVAVTDEDALIGCGNVQQCTIDILSGKSLKYGSITVDLSTMEILKIDIESSKIQINKIEPFNNSIEIKYPSLIK